MKKPRVLEPTDLDILLAGSRHARRQYDKIQDFVIGHRLYVGQPDDKSHADIVLDLARRQLEAQKSKGGDAE